MVVDAVSFDKNNLKNNDLLNSFWNKGVNYLKITNIWKKWVVKYYPLPEWCHEFFWNNTVNSDREQYNIISKIMNIWITVSNEWLNYLRNLMLFEKVSFYIGGGGCCKFW